MSNQQAKGEQKKFVQKPSRQIRFRTSKDGKYVMVDITETWFFSSRYISKISENAGKPKLETTIGEKERRAQEMEE